MKNLLSFLFFFFTMTLSFAQTLDWLSTDGGLKSDKATTIVVDDEDNVYVTGGFYGTEEFGPVTFTSYGDEER